MNEMVSATMKQLEAPQKEFDEVRDCATDIRSRILLEKKEEQEARRSMQLAKATTRHLLDEQVEQEAERKQKDSSKRQSELLQREKDTATKYMRAQEEADKTRGWCYTDEDEESP